MANQTTDGARRHAPPAARGLDRPRPLRYKGAMPSPAPPLLARALPVLAGLAVFTCGWLAMKSDDWRGMVAWSLLAFAVALLASALKRRLG